MKIYITRHGQVLPESFYDDVQFPAGDESISELGRVQANRLGNYLKSIGFSGKIYASPFIRTLETAEIIADCTGSEIIPWAPMREIVKRKEAIAQFRGLTFDEISNRFSHIAPDTSMTYPWWTIHEETGDDVTERIVAGLKEIEISEDVLFVGHGASVSQMCQIMGINATGRACNCSLSSVDTEGKSKPIFADTAYLPFEERSYNSVMCSDEAKKAVDKSIEKLIIPEEVKNTDAVKILHIGDTPSWAYSYYEKLIDGVKPDIIIHTGDFSDEVKVGRIAGCADEYEKNIKAICGILSESTAKKIYAVCGNNDIEAVVKKYLPEAEFTENNAVKNICGIMCNLGHAHYDATKDAEWSFYGHGLTGETWTPEMNDVKKGVCRFNVVRGCSLITLPERNLYSFDNPEF